MPERVSRDAYGLKLAEAAALRADCTRRQVGAVIIAPDGSIVSTGYNGLSSGLPGCASAGACPRGQMAYPSEPPLSVGDYDFLAKDAYPEDDLQDCSEGSPTSPFGCTREVGHRGWHVASTGFGSPVLDLWPPTVVQPASVGYEATGCRAVHAEINAILRGRGREGCVGATIYVTDEPCFHCSVVIEGAGIVRVVTPEIQGLKRLAEEADKPPVYMTSPALLAAVAEGVIAPETAEVALTKGGFPQDLYDALVRQAAQHYPHVLTNEEREAAMDGLQ